MTNEGKCGMISENPGMQEGRGLSLGLAHDSPGPLWGTRCFSQGVLDRPLVLETDYALEYFKDPVADVNGIGILVKVWVLVLVKVKLIVGGDSLRNLSTRFL